MDTGEDGDGVILLALLLGRALTDTGSGPRASNRLSPGHGVAHPSIHFSIINMGAAHGSPTQAQQTD